MKYIVSRTSDFSGKTAPCEGAVKTKFTSRRDVRGFKTIEEFKEKIPNAFLDNPETGYTRKSRPFRLLKGEFEMWTIDIEDLVSWVESLERAVIISSTNEKFPDFPDICELEIYDDYRE